MKVFFDFVLQNPVAFLSCFFFLSILQQNVLPVDSFPQLRLNDASCEIRSFDRFILVRIVVARPLHNVKHRRDINVIVRMSPVFHHTGQFIHAITPQLHILPNLFFQHHAHVPQSPLFMHFRNRIKFAELPCSPHTAPPAHQGPVSQQ